MIVEAKYREDGTPEFEASDFKELEARARGPDVLTEQEEAMVAAAKEEGNAHFAEARFREALSKYSQGLMVFADRSGDNRQRQLKSKLLANRAECLLRLEQWEAASKAADAALLCEPGNNKIITAAKVRLRRKSHAGA